VLKIQEGSLWPLMLFKRPLTPSFITILQSIVMLLFSYHLPLSLSHYCSSCFTAFVLEELGATLLLQPLPFGNKKSFGGIVEYGLGLGILIYCEVKSFFESFVNFSIVAWVN
jgi:hypothetical protein